MVLSCQRNILFWPRAPTCPKPWVELLTSCFLRTLLLALLTAKVRQPLPLTTSRRSYLLPTGKLLFSRSICDSQSLSNNSVRNLYPSLLEDHPFELEPSGLYKLATLQFLNISAYYQFEHRDAESVDYKGDCTYVVRGILWSTDGSTEEYTTFVNRELEQLDLTFHNPHRPKPPSHPVASKEIEFQGTTLHLVESWDMASAAYDDGTIQEDERLMRKELDYTTHHTRRRVKLQDGQKASKIGRRTDTPENRLQGQFLSARDPVGKHHHLKQGKFDEIPEYERCKDMAELVKNPKSKRKPNLGAYKPKDTIIPKEPLGTAEERFWLHAPMDIDEDGYATRRPPKKESPDFTYPPERPGDVTYEIDHVDDDGIKEVAVTQQDGASASPAEQTTAHPPPFTDNVVIAASALDNFFGKGPIVPSAAPPSEGDWDELVASLTDDPGPTLTSDEEVPWLADVADLAEKASSEKKRGEHADVKTNRDNGSRTSSKRKLADSQEPESPEHDLAQKSTKSKRARKPNKTYSRKAKIEKSPTGKRKATKVIDPDSNREEPSAKARKIFQKRATENNGDENATFATSGSSSPDLVAQPSSAATDGKSPKDDEEKVSKDDQPATKATKDTKSARKAPQPKKDKQKNAQTSRKNEAGEDWNTDFVFPAKGQNRATVNSSDLRRLNKNEWLNDNLVNIGMRLLEHNKAETSGKVRVFNSFFYQALTSETSGKRINFEKVKRWTAKDRLLGEYDHAIVPVNLNQHWHVVLMCNLKGLMKPASEASRPSEAMEAEPGKRTRRSPRNKQKPQDSSAPLILSCDSLGEDHSPVVEQLKQYLKAEAHDKLGHEMTVPEDYWPSNLPRQRNLCDCGVYAVGYVARFLDGPEKFIEHALSTEGVKSGYWSDFKAPSYREEIRRMILEERERGLKQGGKQNDEQSATAREEREQESEQGGTGSKKRKATEEVESETPPTKRAKGPREAEEYKKPGTPRRRGGKK